MDSADHYQNAVNLISVVESSPQERPVVVLNSGEIFSEEVKIRKYNREESEGAANYVSLIVPYNSAEEAKARPPLQQQWMGGIGKVAGAIEKGGASKTGAYFVLAEKEFKKAVGSAQGMIPKKTVKAVAKKEAAPAPAAAILSQPQVQQRDAVTRPPAPKSPDRSTPDLSKTHKDAAVELHAVVPSTAPAEINVKPAGTGAVLPTLPLAEQISELDKISMGLDGNVFNKEQLKIISDEVASLSKIVMVSEKGPMPGGLVQLRNQKLRSVTEKLQKIGA